VKIHSDTLTSGDLHSAANAAGVWVDAIERGSRSRRRAFDFRLAGDSSRPRNSGTHGAERVASATWDQHGHWMADLFDRDPAAIIGPYDGRDDFHQQTDGAYADPDPQQSPTDTSARP
jgi:hypothetical protein